MPNAATDQPCCQVCDTPFVPGKPNCVKCDSPRKAKEQEGAKVFRRGAWRKGLDAQQKMRTTEAQLQERRRRAKRIVQRLVDLPVL